MKVGPSPLAGAFRLEPTRPLFDAVERANLVARLQHSPPQLVSQRLEGDARCQVFALFLSD